MKLLILLVAVCIVSTQAFVKRDAPAEAVTKNVLDAMKDIAQGSGQQIQAGFEKIQEFVKENIKLDDIQKKIQEISSNVQKSIAELKPKESNEAPKAA